MIIFDTIASAVISLTLPTIVVNFMELYRRRDEVRNWKDYLSDLRQNSESENVKELNNNNTNANARMQQHLKVCVINEFY